MFNFAVIVPTILRSSLLRACQSVIEQTTDGSINLLIGVDFPQGNLTLLDEVLRMERPKRKITIINPGYSTSTIRGGPFPNPYGGGIRTICSYAANARYLAYLDDDNWFAPDHLETLASAIKDKDWAFSRRIFVDESTRRPLGEDRWESVGPGQGVFAEKFGGFCDTSTLLLDGAKCHHIFPLWSFPMFPNGVGEDRRVFDALRKQSYGYSAKPTVYYLMNRTDSMHFKRLAWLKSAGIKVQLPHTFESALREIQPRSPAEALSEPFPLDLQGWGGSRSPAVAEVLRKLKPRNIIEVGSWKGASAIFMCETLVAQGVQPHVLCVDTWLGGLDHLENPQWRAELRLRHGYPALYYQFLSNVLHRGCDKFIVPFPTTSRQAARFLQRRQVLADFIYIDAGHEEDDVWEDLREYWKLLRAGGVMMGDDYKPRVWPGVVRAVTRFGEAIGQRPQICGEADAQQFLFQKSLMH